MIFEFDAIDQQKMVIDDACYTLAYMPNKEILTAAGYMNRSLTCDQFCDLHNQ